MTTRLPSWPSLPRVATAPRSRFGRGRFDRDSALLVQFAPGGTAGIENLEDRVLLSGNVTVDYTAAGDLRVTGNAEPNQIQIIQNGNLVCVSGVPGTGTSINGANGASCYLLSTGRIERNLIVNLGGGDDYLEIDSVGSTNLNVGGSLLVNAGAGSDTVGVFRTDVVKNFTLLGGSGDELIALNRVEVFGQLRMTMAAGVDIVGIQQYVTVQGRATISMGPDVDGLLLAGYWASPLKVDMGSADDFVGVYKANILTSSQVNLGGGNDRLYVSKDCGGADQVVWQGLSGTDYLGVDPALAAALSYRSMEQVVNPDPNTSTALGDAAFYFVAFYASRGGDTADLF